MRSCLLNYFALTIALFTSTQPAYSAEQTASLEAHVHGLSELTIVMVDKTLEIQLTSPAMNLVGFEHKANTQEQILAIKKVESQHRQHQNLFIFSGGHCEHIENSVDITSLFNSDDDNKNEHSHIHTNHAQDQDHTEIVANYKYHCRNSSTPSSITVNLFKSFPGIDKINAMWVKQTKQGSATLTSKKTIIVFR